MTEQALRKQTSARPKGSGRARSRANGGTSTREFILDEATKLFAKLGYDRVTVRDISAATNLSMPTLYHHFGDKEKLYREVESKCYGALRDRLLSALETEGDAEERLRNFVAHMYDALLNDTVFRNIAVRNMLDPSAVNHKFLVSVSMQHVHGGFSQLLNELRPGTGDGIAPMVILSGILGFVLMSPAKRQLGDYPYHQRKDAPLERETFIDFVVSAALNA